MWAWARYGALARANTSKDPRKQVEINVAGQRLPLVNLDFLGISLAGSAIPPGVPPHDEMAKWCSESLIYASEVQIPAMVMSNGSLSRRIQKRLYSLAGRDLCSFTVAMCAFFSPLQETITVQATFEGAMDLESVCHHVHLGGGVKAGSVGFTVTPYFAVSLALCVHRWIFQREDAIRARPVLSPPCSVGFRPMGEGPPVAAATDYVALSMLKLGFAPPQGPFAEFPWRCSVDDIEEGQPPQLLTYVGPGSIALREPATVWATLFIPGQHGEQEECVSRFRGLMQSAWASESASLRALGTEPLAQRLPELAGHVLACECPKGLPCHADIFIDMFYARQNAMTRLPALLPLAFMPARPAVRFPQEAFAAAVKSLFPWPMVEQLKMPFVEDLLNGPVFTEFAQWAVDHGMSLAAGSPPADVQTRDRR